MKKKFSRRNYKAFVLNDQSKSSFSVPFSYVIIDNI